MLERESFFNSFGVPKEVVKAELFLLGFDDLKVQSEDYLLIDCHSRRVGIYAFTKLLCDPPKADKCEVIVIPFRELFVCEDSMRYHLHPRQEYITKKYINSYNQNIALVDTLGNIFFANIISGGNKDVAPLFYKIVYENAHPIIDVLPDTIYQRLYEYERMSLQLQINAVRKAIKEAGRLLKAKEAQCNELIKNAKNEGIEQGMLLMAEFLAKSDDFNVKNGFLVYKRRIKCDKVKKGMKIYKIPENSDILYIDGLAIEIGSTITRVICDKAYHPNVSRDNEVCIGEMRYKPFTKENVETLIASLRTCNLDSAYDNKAKQYLLDLYYKNQLTEEEDYVYS